MKLNKIQIQKLKELMVVSCKKGNLANSGLVLENGKDVEYAESWVVSNHDATAHSERMLVETVCKSRKSNWTPGLTMITVIEPCLMCLSACSQAGYKEIAYIIPGNKYTEKIPWTTDSTKLDKSSIAMKFSNPLNYIHLKNLEKEFSDIFEKLMSEKLNIKLP
jgi:tRNA(Arg) A34 adenosine deaminase TadA